MFPIKSTTYVGILLLATCTVLTQCALEPSVSTDTFLDNADGDDKNDADESPLTMHKRPSFFVGSRYGRSGPVAARPFYATSKTRRLNVVPRNDRFFLGSRYGKRASEYMSPYEQDNYEASSSSVLAPLQSTPIAHTINNENIDNTENNSDSSRSGSGSSLGRSNTVANAINNNNYETPYMMSCIYTGLKNYYRCNNIMI